MAGGERAGEGLFQRQAALLSWPALRDFRFQAAHQFQLHAKHADQDRHQGAEQAGHQVAEDGPDRRAPCLTLALIFFHVHASPPATRCRSFTIFFCA